MKVGDLVKRKGKDWTALVLNTLCAPGISTYASDPAVRYVEIMWCKDAEIDSCAASLLEVINESR
ncbi:hypothetical protein CL634_10015 [bacterium]|nr:hypothetical protein [bacterium]